MLSNFYNRASNLYSKYFTFDDYDKKFIVCTTFGTFSLIFLGLTTGHIKVFNETFINFNNYHYLLISLYFSYNSFMGAIIGIIIVNNLPIKILSLTMTGVCLLFIKNTLFK